MVKQYQIWIVQSLREYDNELNRKILNDEIKRPIRELVMTPDTFHQVFSPERIKLLQKINRNHIKNIYQLAKELNKPYEVVFRNIKYLEGLGLVKITTKDKKKIPSLRPFTFDMFPSAEA